MTHGIVLSRKKSATAADESPRSLRTSVSVCAGRSHIPCAKYTTANRRARRRTSGVSSGRSRVSHARIARVILLAATDFLGALRHGHAGDGLGSPEPAAGLARLLDHLEEHGQHDE